MGLGTTLRSIAADGLRTLRHLLHTDEEEAPPPARVADLPPPALEGLPSPSAAAPVDVSPPVEVSPPVAADLAEPAGAGSLLAALDEDEGDPAIVEAVIEALHTIYDPEIPVDIYELGLIYGVAVDEDRQVRVTMTLTSPNCPSAQALPEEVRVKVEAIEGVNGADVEIVWEPAWTPERMSEEARLELNM